MSLVAVVDGHAVASAGLYAGPVHVRRRHVSVLGISVAAGFQGHGIGHALMQALTDYADQWGQVLRIELTVFADNLRAIALYERFGFEREGLHRGYALRGGRADFRLELLLLGVAFAVALGVAVLGVQAQAVPHRLFLSLYASAIGLAFVLVQVTLGLRPQLSDEVRETARASYAHTTLAKVDCADALARLEALMQSQRLYTDPDLSLAGLASQLGLGAHQLSELVNSRLGKGFSRYLRECRVDAAKTMLLAEPRAEAVASIRAPLMLHYAGLDQGINAGIAAYEAALKAAGKTYELHMYEGVNHAFNNDTNAARYDKAAADLAWSRTVAFLKRHLA